MRRGVEKKNAPEILRAMASTFEERSASYKEGHVILGRVIAAIYPEGIPPRIAHSPRFHFFYMILSKAVRLVTADLGHEDSAHDIGVYAAMLEASIFNEREEET